MQEKEQQWRDLGKLKKAKEGKFFTLGRALLSVNWSSDWTWAHVTKDGDLRHMLIALNRTDRLGVDGSIISIYSFFFFKLTFTLGFARK